MPRKASAAPKAELPGGFRPDGSWRPAYHGKDDVTAFVWRLVRERRTRSISPAWIAAQVSGSAFTKIMSPFSMEQWFELGDHLDWPLTQCRTSAEEAIKRAGYGAASEFRGGWCVPPDSPIQFAPARYVDAKTMQQFIDTIDVGADVPPPMEG